MDIGDCWLGVYVQNRHAKWYVLQAKFFVSFSML